MDEFTRDDLGTLLEHSAQWCVSIFMPTHRAGPDVQTDSIRLKNLLREAERRLKGVRLRSPEVQAVMEPASRLLDDSLFWRYQSDGLAVFRAGDLFRAYRLPLTFPEVVVVSRRFHLKPLLPLFTEDGHFYVLAVSQNDIRLFLGTRHTLDEIALNNLPRSLDEALKDDDPERQLQFHTGAPRVGQRRAAIFHGYGAGVDDAKDNILRFFRLVDQGLQAHLRAERAPLVLAGVEFLLPIYRQANTYPRLTDGGFTGNPESLTPQALHAGTWPLVESQFRRAREDAAAQYFALAGTGRTSTDLLTILPAAHHGRVETVFVALGRQRWGTVDAARGAVHVREKPRPGDEDLLNVAALQTLVRGGAVYAVDPREVPGGEPPPDVAAVFRY